MDNFQAVIDALILVWAFIYTIVCTRSEGSGEAARKRRRVCARADQIFTKNLKSNELTRFFTKRPFSYEKLWLFSHNDWWQ